MRIGEKLVADAPAVHYYRNRLANVYARYAEFQRSHGRPQEAEAAYRKSIGLSETLEAERPASTVTDRAWTACTGGSGPCWWTSADMTRRKTFSGESTRCSAWDRRLSRGTSVPTRPD